MQNLAFEIAQNYAKFCNWKNRKVQNLQNIYKYGGFHVFFAECCRKMGTFWVIAEILCGLQNLQKDDMELAKR